jgi:hypothetical protein
VRPRSSPAGRWPGPGSSIRRRTSAPPRQGHGRYGPHPAAVLRGASRGRPAERVGTFRQVRQVALAAIRHLTRERRGPLSAGAGPGERARGRGPDQGGDRARLVNPRG